MLDFYIKIQRVLQLEVDKGYQDSAVSGGLRNFSHFIKEQGGKEDIPQSSIDLLEKLFNTYARFSFSKRKEIISIVLDWISAGSQPETINQLDKLLEKKQAPQKEPGFTPSFQDPALYADIRSIRGIGDKNYIYFDKLGVKNIYQLLRYFPRRYQDFSQLKTINSISKGEEITVAGLIAGEILNRKSKRGNLKISETTLTDSTGALRLTWFNQPFISNQLSQGMSIIVSGKIDEYRGRFVINSPVWERLDQDQIHTNRIVPIYSATAGITPRQIRKIISQNLSFWVSRYAEYIPSNIIEKEGFLPLDSAISQIHFPDSNELLLDAQKRFAFEELLFLQLGILIQREKWQTKTSRTFSIDDGIVQNRMEKLPYALTNAQIKAINDIDKDLSSGKPMNRLLQGDVGSGKTVVAKFAIETIIDNGAQTAIMAPTSILAEQHFVTLSELLIESGAVSSSEIALLVGQLPQSEKKSILEGLENGVIKCVIGTHALIEDPVLFKDLQFVIIDEQHRFGVNQRNKLSAKGENIHILVMSATPIPRSLALTLYGDLDITTIDEMPPGRKPVKTTLIKPAHRGKAYSMIKDEINKGFQAFVVYPLIDADDEGEESYKSAVKEHKRLQNSVFPQNKVGLLHGRMKPQEKDEIMADFRNHKFDILVSTTVIEVGVDIPDATIVLIESANFFGLAQLHQIRGRVGRNAEESSCILIPENDDSSENKRLIAMTKINDGFKLAEIDLDFRGPGDFLGTRQSGFKALRFAKLSDTKLIEISREHAQDIIKRDLFLEHTDNQLLREELINNWPEIKEILFNEH